MKKMHRVSAAVVTALASGGVASAAVYNESIDGDLADVASGGTLFNLDVGVNSVIGEITANPTGGIEEDFVVFEVGPGELVTSIVLTDVVFVDGNFSTGFRPYADLGSGLEQISSGSFDESDIGTDFLTVWNLADVGGAPLGPGTYGVVVAEFTPGQKYAFDITLVPAPGTAAALGLAGLAAIRRRR